MIYLDNGATTYPKPQAVTQAVCSAMREYGANPGRSGHRMSVRVGEMIFQCRKSLAELYDAEDPANVILTDSCTTALNTVIHGLLRRGDHAVVSSLEHNAVVRPLEQLSKEGVSYSVAEVAEGDDEATIRNFRNQFRANTKLVVCTHASNVFGIRLPVERLAALCRLNGILFCLDDAQGGGVLPISLKNSSIDYLCAAGHKGLYGPMGTGILIINSQTVPDSLTQGGTGSFSAEPLQPSVLPDRFESGTPNVSGIAGLNAGVRFVLNRTPARIDAYEMSLARRLYDRLSKISGVTLYTQRPEAHSHVPVLSFNIDDVDSERVAAILSDRFGIAVRAGLHCAPLAHRSMGTLDTGTVRVVPCVFNTARQMDIVGAAVNKIVNLNEKKVAINTQSVLE